MITVRILRTEKGVIQGFESSGHAGYADPGFDIICSAVSILVTNTINSIEVFLPDEYMYVEEDEKAGRIMLKLSEEPSEKAVLLLNSMAYGIRDIIRNYSNEYVELLDPDGI